MGRLRKSRRRLLVLLVVALVAMGITAPFIVERTVALYTDGQTIRAPTRDVDRVVRKVLWNPPRALDSILDRPEVDEYEPRVSPRGDLLVFTRGRPGENSDLWAAVRGRNGWEAPERIESISSDADELGAAFGPNGDTLFFSSNRPGGLGGFDIWRTRRDGDGWGSPEPLADAVNSSWNELDPALDAAGRLYFTSDRAGGESGAPSIPWRGTVRSRLEPADYDIFLAVPSGGGDRAYVAAQPLAPLNRKGSAEGCVAIAPFGDFIYFASNRPGGAGGFDLYRSRILDGVPDAPESLGPIVNTAADELDPALASAGFELYFARAVDGREDIFVTTSREVYVTEEGRGPYWSFAALLDFIARALRAIPPDILVLILGLALCLLLALLLRFFRGRWQPSLFAKALLIALLAHLLAAIWMKRNDVQRILLAAVSEETRFEAFEVAVDGLAEEAVGLAIREAEAREEVEDVAALPPVDSPALVRLEPRVVPRVPERAFTRDVTRESEAGDLALFEPERPAAPDPTSPRIGASATLPEPSEILEREVATRSMASHDLQKPEVSVRPLAIPEERETRERSLTLAPSPEPARRETDGDAGDASAIEAMRSRWPSRRAIAASESVPDLLPRATNDASLPRDPGPLPSPEVTVPAIPDVPLRGDRETSLSRPEIANARSLPARAATTAGAPERTPSELLTGREGPRVAERAQPVPETESRGRFLEIPVPRPLEGAPSTALPAARGAPALPAVSPSASLPELPGLADLARATAPREVASEFLPRIYELRTKDRREEALVAGGGSAATEKAVDAGLDWLARHQSPDGRWTLDRYTEHLRDVSPRDLRHPDWNGGGAYRSLGGSGRAADGDTAATGLALLAFLGHGDTHTGDGTYRDVVARGLAWLTGAQKADGDLRGGGNLYMHGIAAFALCEAYAFTRDPALRDAAKKALDYTVRTQNPQRGGWRYEPWPEDGDVDTSVFGWMLMALKSAKLGELDVPSLCLARAGGYLDSVRFGGAGGRFYYQPGQSRTSLAMTAQGFFAQEMLASILLTEEERRSLNVRRAAEESISFLLQNLPEPRDMEGVNFYYWYYATLALFQVGGEPFRIWNERMSTLLVREQVGPEHGSARGSWDPRGQRAETGGRVYSTALSILCLEVYYRYAPLERR